MPTFLYELETLVFTRHTHAVEYTLRIESLRIGRGAKLALLGPSGCGKSTCMDILAMILRPDSAERFVVRLPQKSAQNGEDAADSDILQLWNAQAQDRLARLRMYGLAYVLQSGGLLPFLSNRQNILLPCRALERDAGQCNTALLELSEQLGIIHLLDTMPDRLSMGERQRVAIARALLPRPAVILADEPTAALDPLNARAVMKIFSELAEKAGTTLVLVSHAEALVRDNGFTCLSMPIVADKAHQHIEARIAAYQG